MGLATSRAPNALPKKRGGDVCGGGNGTPSSPGPQCSAEGEGGSEPPFLSDPTSSKEKRGEGAQGPPSLSPEEGEGGRVPGTRVPPSPRVPNGKGGGKAWGLACPSAGSPAHW